jgi:hypothetical protein
MKRAPATSRSKVETPIYKNPSVPTAKRVHDLLSRMTLEEKAEQMLCIWQQKAEKLVDAQGNFDEAKAKRRSATDGPRARWAALAMRAAARPRAAWRS